jgi:acyl carrier protein
MDPGLAIKALSQALDGTDHLLAIMDVDWTQFSGATQRPLLRDLPDVELAADGPAAAGDELTEVELRQQLAGLPRARQTQVLTDLIRNGAASVLGHDSAEAVEATRTFGDLGFDSLTSLEMRQHLNAATGLKLPATLLFDYPTPAVLAEYLWAETFEQETDHQPVLDELDRLTSLLSSIATDRAGRAEITARLEAMTQQLRDEAQSDAAAERELAAATNDEMFDLIDEELRDSDFD